MKTKDETQQKLASNLIPFDEFLIADTRVVVAKVATNRYGAIVLTLGIFEAKTKKDNQMTLILPAKTKVTILKKTL